MAQRVEKPRLQRSMKTLLGALALLASLAAARAETVEEFYRKTPLSVYVGSGAGGGFDEIARVFTPFLAKHLPGNPAIVVKNNPGAGGLINVNYMWNQAPRDGSAIAAPFNTVFMLPLFGDAAAKFDSRKFTWLGSLDRLTGVCLVWHTVPVNSIEDAKKRQVLVSATGTNSTPAIFSNVLNTLLGTKFKVISGYQTSETRLAVERGETEGICGLGWQTFKAVSPKWIEQKLVKNLAQLGLSKHKDMPDVPLALDMFANDSDRRVFELVVLPQEFGRPFMAPPDLPPDRAAALKLAFDRAIADPAAIAELAKIRIELDPMRGDDIVALLERAWSAPKEDIARAAKFSLAQ